LLLLNKTIIKICLLLLVAEKSATIAEIESAAKISFLTYFIINTSLIDFMSIDGE
jgi:hypothetical protein